MKYWDVKDKANWDYTGCVVRDDAYKIAYVTGRKEMPHGTFWVGYYYDDCKCWCARNIKAVLADSKEDYELYKQGLLTPDINPNVIERVAEFERWFKSHNILWRIWWRGKHIFFWYDPPSADRLRTVSCNSCGHYFNGGLKLDGAIYNDIEQLRRPHVTCPYCGESDQDKISWWG